MIKGFFKYFILFNVIFACKNYNSNNNVKFTNKNIRNDSGCKALAYTSIILEIAKNSKGNGTWDALFKEPKFIKIYEKPTCYIDSTIDFLSNDTYSLHQKTVCIYSMQKLNLKDYIMILNASSDLFQKKKIPEELLEIEKILKKIIDNKELSSNLKNILERILSGEYWKKLKEFEDNNE
jgi:hypothetical protein